MHLVRQVREWAESRSDVAAVLLVGSHARGDARPDSDEDFVILSESPEPLLRDEFPKQFGQVVREELEDFGRVTSRRIWYASGSEVEFAIGALDWATEPEEGTRAVVRGGCVVLYDSHKVASNLVDDYKE